MWHIRKIRRAFWFAEFMRERRGLLPGTKPAGVIWKREDCGEISSGRLSEKWMNCVKSCISRLEMHISSLKMYISSLEVYVFSLEMNFPEASDGFCAERMLFRSSGNRISVGRPGRSFVDSGMDFMKNVKTSVGLRWKKVRKKLCLHAGYFAQLFSAPAVCFNKNWLFLLD